MNRKQRRAQTKAVAPPPSGADAVAQRAFAEALKRHQIGQFAEAEQLYRQAIAARPTYAEAYGNRGAALQSLGLLEDAVASYRQAIALKPDYAQAYNNLSVSLQRLGLLDEALASCRQALVLKLDTAEVHFNLAAILQDLGHLEEAVAHYRWGLIRDPRPNADVHYNIGAALHRLRRLEEALVSFDAALKIRPDVKYLLGDHLYILMYLCDWSAASGKIGNLLQEIERGKKVATPFALGALTDRLPILRAAAETVIADRHPASSELPALARRPRREKIRIGYFSADFRDHPVAHAIAEILELHDREKFEVVAVSFGKDPDDQMKQRIIRAVDEFVDVHARSDRDVALLSRSLGIDIAVDLSGFTEGCRPGIFSRRAAPIQVNYLGYGGTMGAEYIDYIVADKTLIPEHAKEFYAEKVAFLPNTCLPKSSLDARLNPTDEDRRRFRQQAGLPADGFVFCCFNSSYKILPDMFDMWMRILAQVDGSVLWLLEYNSTVTRNLRKAAAARGIDPERLIFAKRVSQEEYVQRYYAADLFLDTWPYTAGSVARECLWAGLPLLTLVGDSYVSRMAASLLNALDLPELVATTAEQYEATAIGLARNPERLTQAVKTLERSRVATACFDVKLLTRNLEDAYGQMYERHQRDMAPSDIYVGVQA